MKNQKNVQPSHYSDNQITIKKINMERLKEYEGLNTNIINSLIENCGLDRIKLNNELNKISLYFKDKKLIKIS